MTSPAAPHGSVREVVGVFLRLGTIAFGGPVAHTAMMREELVRRREWVTDERFVDLMGATNLIPGPNSTELAIHLGHERAGWRGLVWAGVCFIVPAALMVTGLAWAYVEYGETPAFESVLYGVVPVVVAIIAHALTGLLRTVLGFRKDARPRWWLVALAGAALAAYFLGVHELVILTSGAALGALAHLVRHPPRRSAAGAVALPLVWASGEEDRLLTLFLTMLKIGSVLYGSGYVLLAFLDGDFVDRLGWITDQQLSDAISVGQVTPGPVFTTATFIGYLVAGPAGAFVATVGIFAPSFVFVGLLTRLTGWLRANDWTSWLLDGVNATALALMAGVSWQLARTAVVDPITVALFATGLVALLWTRLNSGWLIVAGAFVGILLAPSGLLMM
ncbi:chromate efflux transporter [Nocardioides speluncae]|uniref:chromate efflux transporter n=1 Tax=Nocardioides speluncae TaxID=2670337 RepID=UPI001F0B98D2|nr:chromate efflux transporter [Nocardioides speluncae]